MRTFIGLFAIPAFQKADQAKIRILQPILITRSPARPNRPHMPAKFDTFAETGLKTLRDIRQHIHPQHTGIQLFHGIQTVMQHPDPF
ncbi:hypothetical protein CJ010_14665 [Azoarcus sp. DD4]|nr:hypothetical protein CJ010_14665 [Azoarcus sp. DD4]